MLFCIVIQSGAKDLGCIHLCVSEILPPFGRLNDSRGDDGLNEAIHLRNLRLFLLEIPVRVQKVVDRWNEVVVVVATGQIAGESSEEADGTFGRADHEYTEHLALLELGMPIGTALEVRLYFGGCHHAKRMGRVVERIRELLW